jgi:hypothetical protein
MRGLSKLGCLAGTAWFLALAGPASARKFQMSGTWQVRQGGVFVPFQFALPAGGTPMDFVSMGSWTEALFDPPRQVVSDAGPVTATGSAPAALRIPKHRFVRSHDAMIALSGLMIIQITTMLAIDAPYETATLRAGSGPGSFTWCPSNPACTVAGSPPGPPGNNGRVVYAAGANQFGGTMQLGLAGRGLISVRANPAPLWVAHVPFLPVGSGPTLRALAVGAGANDAPHTEMHSLAPALVTLPTMAPAMSSFILYPARSSPPCSGTPRRCRAG